MNEVVKPNWDIFKAKFSENPQSNFEWFCYLLFCREYKRDTGIFRYKNQSAIETNPITVNEDVIGWQAKFYDETLSKRKSELIETIKKAKRDYNDINTLIFYTNQEWGQGKNGNNDSITKKEVEEEARKLNIKIIWNTASFFESPFVSIENSDISSYFFCLENESINKTEINTDITMEANINQNIYINSNYELIEEALKSTFNKLDELLSNRCTEEAEEILDNILIKKQGKLNDYTERQILKYRALCNLERKNFSKVQENINQLLVYGENTEELLMVKFNLAIYKKDDDLFIESKQIMKHLNFNESDINGWEIIFLYKTDQYDKILDNYYKKDFTLNMEGKLYVAKTFDYYGEYEKGEILFEEIREKDDNYFLEYIAHKINCTLRKKNYVSCSEVEKKEFKTCLNMLDSIEVQNLNNNYKLLLIKCKLNILIFLNEKEAMDIVKEYEYIDDLELNLLKLKIYNLNYEEKKAIKLEKELLNKKEDCNTEIIIDCIIRSQYFRKSWEDIKNTFDKYKDTCNFSEFSIFAYGKSLIEIYGEEGARIIFEKEWYYKSPLTSFIKSQMHKKDIEKRTKFLEETLEQTEVDDLLRLDVINEYDSLEEYEKCISILEDNGLKNEMFFEKYLYIILKYQLESKFKQALKIYKLYYIKTNNIKIASCIFRICCHIKKFRRAYYISQKLYFDTNDIFWENEYARMKLYIKEVENLNELKSIAEDLYISSKPEYIMTAAEIYFLMGNNKKSKELCFNILYNLNLEDIPIEYATRIGNLLMNIGRGKFFEQNEQENNCIVSSGNVVILENDNKILKICINEEEEYKNDEYRIGCLHISDSNILKAELNLNTIGNKVIFENETYIIKQIIDKYSYISGLCWGIRLKNNIEPIETIELDEELKNLKQVLAISNENMRDNIDIYMNESNGIGVPINFIAENINKVSGTIYYLLINKEYKFLAGVCANTNKNDKVILSTVSALFLNQYDILEDFINYYQVFIPSKLIEILKNEVRNLNTNFEYMELSISIVENQLFRDEKSIEQKRNGVNRYIKMIELLNKCEVIDMDISKNELIDLPQNIIYSSDIEAFEIAKDKKITIFIDDLFTSRLFYFTNYYKAYLPGISNSAGFIFNQLKVNFEKYYIIFHELFINGYENMVDVYNIYKLILIWKIDLTEYIKKFEEIIRHLVEIGYREYLQNCCRVFHSMRFYSIYEMKIKIDIILNILNEQN